MCPDMDFGDAIRALKDGKKVARKGWNGKDMWLCYMPGVNIAGELVNGRTKKFWPEGDLPVGGYIVIRTAQGGWQPGWHPSTPDMLSEDWVVVE